MAEGGAARADEALPPPQVQLLREQARRTPVALTLVDLFLAWLLLRAGLPVWIVAWVPVGAALQVGRALYFRRLPHDAAPLTGARLRPVLAWFFVLGVVRAIPVVLAFTVDNEELRFLVSVVSMGLAAGGIGSVAGLVSAYVAWALPLCTALALGWLARGGFEGISIAVLLVLMFLILALNVRSYGQALHQLGREVDRANAERQRAEAAVKAKTRFFAAASHDLRQPLGVLRWYGDAVRLHAGQLGHEALMSIGDGIGRALEHAEPLVRKYLDIARLEAGALELAPRRLPLVPLFEQVREGFALDAQAGGVRIEILVPANEAPAAFADEGVVRSIVDNLVGNAVKFTPPGGRVTLAAERSPDGAHVRVSVSDTGIGIAAADHERVFDDFVQLANPERNRSRGLGLGLAIVRRQAALLGTSVRLQSQAGSGARFEFELPLCDAAQDAGAADAPAWPPAPAGTPRVLVIDDEPEIRQALSAMLGAARWQVLVASDLDDARRVLGSTAAVDAVIVDFRLRGDVTGVDVIHALRADGLGAPAVVITGDTSPEQLRQLASIGLPVLHKPVAGDKLLNTLVELMGQEGAVS